MEVHKLVLWVGELEKLRVNGVDSDVFGFPCRPALWHVAQLVERRGTADKCSFGKIVIDINKASCGHVSVKVQNVDRVHQGISDQTCGNVCDGRYGLDVLVEVNGEENFGKQGSWTSDQSFGEIDRREGVLGAVIQFLLLFHV